MSFLKTLKPDGFFVNIPQNKFSRMGVSDTIGVYNGRFFAFESKAKDGKPTALQRMFLRLVTMAGGTCGVTKSVADVKELLNLASDAAYYATFYPEDWPKKLVEIYSKFCSTPKQVLKLLLRWNKNNRPKINLPDSIINDMK